MQTTQIRKSTGLLQSAAPPGFGRDSKTNRRVGKLQDRKKRLRVCPDWSPVEAAGGKTRGWARSLMRKWCIWLPLVDPKLEAKTKIWEAVSY